jgi:HSP20 family protein
MTFASWNPLHELTEAHKHFSTFVNEALRHNTQPQRSQEDWNPAVDVSEAIDSYTFAVELPGIASEMVAVEVKENILTVKGERKAVALKDGERYLHRERPHGHFARVFRMKKPVNAEGVTASYRDGVLSVVVPFRADAKPRKIHVQG